MTTAVKTNRRWLVSVLDAVSDPLPTRLFTRQDSDPIPLRSISKGVAMKLKAAATASSRMAH